MRKKPNSHRVTGNFSGTEDGPGGFFSLYTDTLTQKVLGDVVLGDGRWYRYEMDTDGDVAVTEIPRPSAVCVMEEEINDGDRRQLGAHEGHEHHAVSMTGDKDAHHHHHHHHHGLPQTSYGPGKRARMLQTKRAAGKDKKTSRKQQGRKAQTSSRSFLIYLDMNIMTHPDIDAGISSWGGTTDLVMCNATSASRLPRIMEIVREDYAPFDVTVTSNRTQYDQWNGYRLQVAMIQSVTLGVGSTIGNNRSCGVAFLNSYAAQDNLAWVALCDPRCSANDFMVAQAVSHEAGHTFDLHHDGSAAAGVYLRGIPQTPDTPWPVSRRWNAIMGGSGGWGMAQWSRGEYDGYQNADPDGATEDDLATIYAAIGYRPGSVPCVTVRGPQKTEATRDPQQTDSDR